MDPDVSHACQFLHEARRDRLAAGTHQSVVVFGTGDKVYFQINIKEEYTHNPLLSYKKIYM